MSVMVPTTVTLSPCAMQPIANQAVMATARIACFAFISSLICSRDAAAGTVGGLAFFRLSVCVTRKDVHYNAPGGDVNQFCQ